MLVFGGTGYPFGKLLGLPRVSMTAASLLTNFSGERCSNSMHAFDFSTNKWREITCGGELPTPRYGQSLTYKDGNIYVMGGTSGHEYNMSVRKLTTYNFKEIFMSSHEFGV